MDERMNKWVFYTKERKYKKLVWPETCTHAIGNEWVCTIVMFVCVYIYSMCRRIKSHKNWTTKVYFGD
jgi:hypothetical protein